MHGGKVIAQGTAEEVKLVEGSATGDYLSRKKKNKHTKKEKKVKSEKQLR